MTIAPRVSLAAAAGLAEVGSAAVVVSVAAGLAVEGLAAAGLVEESQGLAGSAVGETEASTRTGQGEAIRAIRGGSSFMGPCAGNPRVRFRKRFTSDRMRRGPTPISRNIT